MRFILVVSSVLLYFFSPGTDIVFMDTLKSNTFLVSHTQTEEAIVTTYSENEAEVVRIINDDKIPQQAVNYDHNPQVAITGYVPDKNPVTWDQNPDNYPLDTPSTYNNVDDIEIQSPTRYSEVPVGACAICGDGSYSFSKNRRGTCSKHRGVAQWLK